MFPEETLFLLRRPLRKELLQMMADAEKGMFDMVFVKDISRFAQGLFRSNPYRRFSYAVTPQHTNEPQ